MSKKKSLTKDMEQPRKETVTTTTITSSGDAPEEPEKKEKDSIQITYLQLTHEQYSNLVKKSELSNIEAELTKLREKNNAYERKVDDHLGHHSERIIKDFVNVLGHPLVTVAVGFVVFVLIAYFVKGKIVEKVNETINSRQCVPDNPIVSSGTFCIK